MFKINSGSTFKSIGISGAWLARRELPIEEVHHELSAFGLEEHVTDVVVFLKESKLVLRKYGALLACFCSLDTCLSPAGPMCYGPDP